MSIRERLEDARILASASRQAGAFIQVLIAAAATSKKRYPSAMWDDGDAFKNFIYDELGIITGGMKYNVQFPFLGKNTPLEEIFYHHLRCQLLHEGELPESIVFTEPRHLDGRTQNVIHLGTPLGFPLGWIDSLATAVWLAPENDELWHDDLKRRQEARFQFGELRHTSSYCRRPGSQTKLMKNKNQKVSWTHDGIAVRVSYSVAVEPTQLAEILEKKAKELRE